MHWCQIVHPWRAPHIPEPRDSPANVEEHLLRPLKHYPRILASCERHAKLEQLRHNFRKVVEEQVLVLSILLCPDTHILILDDSHIRR